jgi:cytochrome c oxidase subunit 1
MSDNNHKGFEAPGTFVLALIFLTTFVVIYFLNVKYLSTLWELR